MTAIITIALDKLDTDPLNVRKTYSADGVEQLAASIAANGVLQNLVVRKGKKDRYLVVAGGRRLRALTLLAEQGRVATDFAVNCILRQDSEATELSLAENFIRESMNPADEYLAFAAVAQTGTPVADIAARFGVTEATVRKRLALARVSPVLIELFRDGELTLDQLSAFTVSDDHNAQERVWNALSQWNRHAHSIRAALSGEAVKASDKRIRFLGGLDVYEAAGGEVRRDLFDRDNEGFALDAPLVETLVTAKLQEIVEAVKAEGWTWTEIMAEISYDILSPYGRVYPQPADLSDEQRFELDQLTEQHEALAEQIENGEADDSAEDELAAIQNRIDALDTASYSNEDFARAGAIIGLDYKGDVRIERGLIRPQDKLQAKAEAGTDDGEKSAAPKPVHSATLVEELTAHKTAAIRAELAAKPQVALATVVHTMLLQTMFTHASDRTCLELRLTSAELSTSMKQPETSLALETMSELNERFGDQVPDEPAALFDWCLTRSDSELLDLLAFATAQSVNAVQDKYGFRRGAYQHADRLAAALGMDMRNWFEPTADSYFRHLNRAGIQTAVAEVRGEDFAAGIAAMKKAEAAAYAEQAIKGRGWLPQPLRLAVDAEASDKEACQLAEAAE